LLRVGWSSLWLSLVGVAFAVVPACGGTGSVAGGDGGGGDGAAAIDGGASGGHAGRDGGAVEGGGGGRGGSGVDGGAMVDGEDPNLGAGGPTYPSEMGGRWVGLMSPTAAEKFVAPSTLRLIAAAHDFTVATNSPSVGHGGNAQSVEFFVDGKSVLAVQGDVAEYWIFKGQIAGLGAGTHEVWARANYVDPELILESAPALVTVTDPPSYARTVSLDADVVVSAAQAYELVGAPDARIRLQGNGHSIVSAGTLTGALTLKYVDVFDLGSREDPADPGIQVATEGTITIEDSTFDTSNALDVATQGGATVSVRRNLFRSNLRVPLGQSPSSAGDSPSYPTARFTGNSTGDKVFAGNNVAAGWVQFDKTTGWIVGGATDADSNVIIGPRGGIYVQESDSVHVRNNYSHDVYFGGWSQGSNFELGGSPKAIVEHNIICHGSWPVRGAGGVFRYNIVAEAGHQFLWPDTGGSIHHNIFVGGESDIAGIFLVKGIRDVRVYNNTIDGQLSPAMVTAVDVGDAAVLSLTSNAFVNVPKPPGPGPGATVMIDGGMLMADYNAFANEQPNAYSDGRKAVNDVIVQGGGAAAFVDPPATACEWDDFALWTRETSVRSVLADYRRRYTPKDGSPLIDKGDPSGGAGNDIGAVGAGAPNDDDQFGKL
jgi:hypothetical protein